MYFFLVGGNEYYTNSHSFLEYAPSKNIFHIPSTSLVDITKGSAGVMDFLYSSFTVRMQQPISSSKT
jgi:hypothetical protein